MNIFEKAQEEISKCFKHGKKSFMEFVQSEIHECSEKKDNRIIFYITPDKILKYNTNVQSTFGFSPGVPVKCCMWCGFMLPRSENE